MDDKRNGLFDFLDDIYQWEYTPITFNFLHLNFGKEMIAKIVINNKEDIYDPVVYVENIGLMKLDKFYELNVGNIGKFYELLLISPSNCTEGNYGIKLVKEGSDGIGDVNLEEFKDFVTYLLTFEHGMPKDKFDLYKSYYFDTPNVCNGFSVKLGGVTGLWTPQGAKEENILKFCLRGCIYYQDQYKDKYDLSLVGIGLKDVV